MTLSTEREERPTRMELGRHLLETGSMTADWLPAFSAVDRAQFLPPVMWPFDMASQTTTVSDRAADPAGWHRHADADTPITTQWDDGAHPGPGPGRVPTSSSSMPSVVFPMLHALDVSTGMRVLEIGTGTGWNAGLLTHRLGDANVTTVDVHPTVTDQARTALEQAGLHPTVVNTDGTFGHPPNAPYDRVIATCGIRNIPHAWIRQSKPGALIVAPWGTHYTNRDTVVRLTVTEDLSHASGHFTGPVEFMKLRSQRLARPPHTDYLPNRFPGDAEASLRSLPTANGFADPFSAGEFAASLRVPRCAHTSDTRGGARSSWLYSLSDQSWAAAFHRLGEPTATVHQSGPRRLWDELENAHHWWEDRGRPGIERFGLTVSPGEQQAWLDDPATSWPV